MTRSCRHRTTAVALALLATATLACNGNKGPGEGTDTAASSADDELKEPIALIAGYTPYLRNPEKEEREPYMPERRSDVIQTSFFAANEIRHTANRARQQAERSGSALGKQLAGPLLEVAKACADPRELEVVDGCIVAVKALDAALEKIGGKLPRLSPAGVTDKAREAMKTFLLAIGPSDKEKDYRAKVVDESAVPRDVINACEAASGQAQALESELAKVGEELRKLGVHHRLALESQCNRIGYAESVRLGLEACEKEKTKEKKDPECLNGCAKAQKTFNEGIPAAAFSKLEEMHKEQCKDVK